MALISYNVSIRVISTFIFRQRDTPVQKRTASFSRLLVLLSLTTVLTLPIQAQAQAQTQVEAAATPVRGWQPLVNLLGALTPSVDTSLALTPKDVTDRITQLLDQGQNQMALDAITARLQQRENNAEINIDVQLLFLQGRAQSQLGLRNDAIESYKQLTIFYPELPEPWNNLATEYMRQGNLDLAAEALDMALLASPDYTLALQNQGELQLMLAHDSFKKAGNLQRSQETEYVLQP